VTDEEWEARKAEHEAWLVHQAKKCGTCDKDATKVIRFTRGCITLTNGYCDECAEEVRESFGSTRSKRERHSYAECQHDEQHFLDYLARLRELYPAPRRPYISTVSMIA